MFPIIHFVFSVSEDPDQCGTELHQLGEALQTVYSFATKREDICLNEFWRCIQLITAHIDDEKEELALLRWAMTHTQEY